MKILFKRIIAFMAVFVISFSFMVTPAYASETGGVSFWDYLSGVFLRDNVTDSLSAWWQNIAGSDDPAAAESDYVTDVTNTFGTSVLGDNCIYLGNWSLDTTKTTSHVVDIGALSSGSTFLWSGSETNIDWTNYQLYLDSTFIAPVTGTYTFTIFDSIQNVGTAQPGFPLGGFIRESIRVSRTGGYYDSSTTDSVNLSIVAGDSVTFQIYYGCSGYGPKDYLIQGAVRMEYPVGGLDAAAGNLDVSADTRAGSLAGDLFYLGDNGEQVVAENVTIFDESSDTYYNPTTGDITDITNWNYDYSDRSYNVTTTSGDTYTITYGDEYITVNEGDTVYTYYYTVPSVDSSSTILDGESGSGTSLIDTIKDGVLGALKTLIEGVFALIKTILEKLLSLAQDLLSFFFDFLSAAVLGGIKDMLSAFNDSSLFQSFSPGDDSGGYALPEGVPVAFSFISGVYMAFPDDLRGVFTFGIAALFLFAIFKLVRS